MNIRDQRFRIKNVISIYPQWIKIKPTMYSNYVTNSEMDKDTYEYHTILGDIHYVLVLLGGDKVNKYNDPWLVCRSRPSIERLKTSRDVMMTYYSSSTNEFTDDSFAYNILMKFSPYDRIQPQLTIDFIMTHLEELLIERML